VQTILKYWRVFILLLERCVADTAVSNIRTSADRPLHLVPYVTEYRNKAVMLPVLFAHCVHLQFVWPIDMLPLGMTLKIQIAFTKRKAHEILGRLATFQYKTHCFLHMNASIVCMKINFTCFIRVWNLVSYNGKTLCWRNSGTGREWGYLNVGGRK
jgi:hypothetical protein